MCSIDRWDFYKDYIHSVYELVKNPPENSLADKQADASFESCHDYLCEVSENLLFNFKNL